MSASGTGPFENDDALDLVDDLKEASEEGRLEMVHESIRQVAEFPEHSFLDRDLGDPAVAAAALVSASVRRDEAIFQEADLSLPFLDCSDALCRLAVAALRRVSQENSEVYREWLELGVGEEWKGRVDTLIEQISQCAG